MTERREKLAALCHEQWAAGVKSLLDQCTEEPDGTLRIPKEVVARVQRAARTPYSDLRENEKLLDRREANIVLALLFPEENHQGDGK